MDFRVGCYRTASAGSALGSFCPCLLWLPSLPPALSGGAGCSLWAGQMAFVHSHSLLIYIYLDFLLPCVRPKPETCHVFPIKSVDLVQMDCLSLHTSPLHQPRSAWLQLCSFKNTVFALPPSHCIPLPAIADNQASLPFLRLKKKKKHLSYCTGFPPNCLDSEKPYSSFSPKFIHGWFVTFC